MAQADILVVDDLATNRAILRRRLELDGHRVREAADGVEAMEAIGAAQPDLILLDVVMPRMDGFEVCRRLRSRITTRGIPIILVTTLSDRETRVAGLEAGADDFIAKPIDPPELTARVRSLLRLRYTQSLLSQRELLDTAIRDLADGIVLVEIDWTVVAANRRACHLLGLSATGETGFDLRARLHGFDAEVDLHAFDPSREQRFDLTRLTSPALILDLRISPVHDQDGKPVYLAISLRDVTAERRADRLRTDFFALTAHKLRTPLTILKGLVELFADEQGRDMAANLLGELMPDLVRKIDDLSQIVDDLLLRHRLDEMVAETVLETALAPVLAAAHDEVAQQRRYAPLDVDLEGGETLLQMAPADLQLVLRELLDNAVKFTGNRPAHVAVTAHRDEHDTPNPVTLTLHDDGVGIPHEHFETVFQECFQVDEHGTGNVPGLGLGLALVKRVVQAYGGEVHIVASDPRSGTVVRLRLP